MVTLFGFLILFAGILWFLPNVDEGDGYTKAYDGFTGTESTGESSLAGTESVMSPVPSQRTMTPTFHSNVSVPLAGNLSASQKAQMSVEGSEVREPSSKSAEAVISNIKPTASASSHVSDENTMRRNKVVEVRACMEAGMGGVNCNNSELCS